MHVPCHQHPRFTQASKKKIASVAEAALCTCLDLTRTDLADSQRPTPLVLQHTRVTLVERLIRGLGSEEEAGTNLACVA